MLDKSEMFKFISRRVLQNSLSLFALGVLFFTIAGTLNVLGFWLYIATALVYQILSLFFIVPRYPAYMELAKVRRTKKTGVKSWDKTVVLVVMLLNFAMYLLAALDAGRLHLSPLPLGLALVGVLFYVAGSALNQWAMLHNPHFERGVRIQTEREHRAIPAAGPYRYVRHPGYLGSLLGFISSPLLIGSGLALVAAVMCCLGMIVRTALEDQTLRQELTGYADYAQTVRYRLIPYIW